MAPRWATFDKMIRDLGAVRSDLDVLEATPAGAVPEANLLRAALSEASDAVHHCLDDDGENAARAARTAITHAQQMLERTRKLIDTARSSREDLRLARSRAARQREETRRWKRAEAFGGDASPEPVAGYDQAEDEPLEDDPDGDEDR